MNIEGARPLLQDNAMCCQLFVLESLLLTCHASERVVTNEASITFVAEPKLLVGRVFNVHVAFVPPEFAVNNPIAELVMAGLTQNESENSFRPFNSAESIVSRMKLFVPVRLSAPPEMPLVTRLAVPEIVP